MLSPETEKSHCDVCYNFCIKQWWCSSLPPVVCRRACLIYVMCLLAYSGVQHILCCVFVLFFFVLCTSFFGLYTSFFVLYTSFFGLSFFDYPFSLFSNVYFFLCLKQKRLENHNNYISSIMCMFSRVWAVFINFQKCDHKITIRSNWNSWEALYWHYTKYSCYDSPVSFVSNRGRNKH
jgi:hypothetical protein